VFVLVHVVLEPDYRRDELGVRGGRCCLRAELLGKETGVHVLSDRTGTLLLFSRAIVAHALLVCVSRCMHRGSTI